MRLNIMEFENMRKIECVWDKHHKLAHNQTNLRVSMYWTIYCHVKLTYFFIPYIGQCIRNHKLEYVSGKLYGTSNILHYTSEGSCVSIKLKCDASKKIFLFNFGKASNLLI